MSSQFTGVQDVNLILTNDLITFPENISKKRDYRRIVSSQGKIRAPSNLQNPFSARNLNHPPLEQICQTIEGDLLEFPDLIPTFGTDMLIGEPIADGAVTFVLKRVRRSVPHHRGVAADGR